ncbi:MAG: ADP-ribosylglycohydrolase family protein [Elusimicrobia bacterium]|nr:ADP-ribosylglycohydrolase family protein [Elusimicrobiota bacterium]
MARDRLAGALLGAALGDALGLPAEGLSAEAIRRRFGRLERFRLLGEAGFVSDDTELAALTAQSLARHPADARACARDFQRALAGWVLRLPWGVGWATLKAGLRSAAGLRETASASAGNGALTRAPIVGVFFAADPDRRRDFVDVLSRTTHSDPRALAAARFAADLAAACATSRRGFPLEVAWDAARGVEEPAVRVALADALALAASEADPTEAAARLGTTGFAVHTVGLGTFMFARYGDAPLRALTETVAAGGDTDSCAALVGAWCGALHGEGALPAALLARIHDGPFGPSHLRALAACLAARTGGAAADTPSYSALGALARNLALMPVILAHGLRRLLP